MKWPRWKPMDLDWLNKLNSVSYQKFYAVWLCVGTFAVWSTCALAGIKLDPVTFAMWLGFVAGLLGINLKTFSVMRSTDYKALDKQAEIERAKAGLPPSPTAETPTK